MHQPTPGKTIHIEPIIKIKGNDNVVEKFTYLGSTFSKSFVMDDEFNTRFTKVSAGFGWLNRNVWNQKGISEAVKIKLYQAVVLTTLLYGCEMWTTYQWHIKKLNHFHMTCLSEEDSQHHMAKTHPQHWSFNLGFSYQHLNHLDAITASLGWSCCLHLRLPLPEETALQQIISG